MVFLCPRIGVLSREEETKPQAKFSPGPGVRRLLFSAHRLKREVNMNKERVLKKVVSDLFTEIFQIGVKMGRTIDLKDEKKDKALRKRLIFE